MRWPWTPDMNTGKEDHHAEMASHSVQVVPPKATTVGFSVSTILTVTITAIAWAGLKRLRS